MNEDDLFAASARSLGGSFVRASRRTDGKLTAEDMVSADAPRGRDSGDSLEIDTATLANQIKNSFELETHSFRSRILEATDEAARARTRINDVQSEMLRLRKKCFKLQKALQERDATIACMQEHQDLQLPMLMHETMRSLHNAGDGDDNAHEDDDGHHHHHHHQSGMRLSIHRNRHQRSIVQERADERVHEYEKQISRLYEELHQEKQKNEMLRECLKEQKHAKTKLMKACKFARREIEALKESDLTHLLEDLEIKCRELEHTNGALQDDVEFERTEAANARHERDEIAAELDARRQDSSEWAARLEAKQREIERLRAQIHEQQCTLENFQQDYDLVADRTGPRTTAGMHSELQQECDMLMRALHRERTRVADLEQQLLLQRSITHDEPQSRTRPPPSNGSTSGGSPPVIDGDHVRYQVARVCDKIRSMHRRLVENTEMQDVYGTQSPFQYQHQATRESALLSSSSASASSRDLLDVRASASEALQQCGDELDTMQHLMDEAFARALGNNCAMQ